MTSNLYYKEKRSGIQEGPFFYPDKSHLKGQKLSHRTWIIHKLFTNNLLNEKVKYDVSQVKKMSDFRDKITSINKIFDLSIMIGH